MFFRKKSNKESKCINCGIMVNEKYNFCPRCGESMINATEEREEFGLLGKTDFTEKDLARSQIGTSEFRIMEKIASSLINNFIKSMEKAEISEFPNGIKIKIGSPMKKQQTHQSRQSPKTISEEQIKKMSAMPRTKAKTSIKRFGDKIIYELNIPGISSPEDIFVSKLESGYEIKAIGEKKVYVNSLPVNLPIKGFVINPDKLLVEFKTSGE